MLCAGELLKPAVGVFLQISNAIYVLVVVGFAKQFLCDVDGWFCFSMIFDGNEENLLK